MNAEKEKALFELARRNPYWICLVVFLALAAEQVIRLQAQLAQRDQLNQAKLIQTQNVSTLYEAQQLETRLQSVSLDLLQLAKTNPVAKQIVTDFNIQWNPAPTPPGPTGATK